MKLLAWLVCTSLTLALPGLAKAADAYVTGNVNLRAGPDSGYPLIDQLQAGTEVNVQGCTAGWEWCDVIAYGNRGWVAGNYVEYVYQDQPVLLPSYGARIGIPIIAFSIGTYWDRYYRSRPFYSRRDYWYQRPVVRRPPPPPIRRPYRGPVRQGNGGGRPQVNRPDPMRPVEHGRPVSQVPNPRQPISQGRPRPASRPAPVRGQPQHDQHGAQRKAPPTKRDDKDHQHDH